jgi:hypothetical protein
MPLTGDSMICFTRVGARFVTPVTVKSADCAPPGSRAVTVCVPGAAAVNVAVAIPDALLAPPGLAVPAPALVVRIAHEPGLLVAARGLDGEIAGQRIGIGIGLGGAPARAEHRGQHQGDRDSMERGKTLPGHQCVPGWSWMP